MRGLIIALLIAPSMGVAQNTSVTQDQGRAAWAQIFEVVSHPRCTNCHVGETGIPMWNGLGYAPDRTHGMHVRAGESRIGAETIPCRTCHITADRANSVPHAAPQILEAWRLPPVELSWLGKQSAELCMQLRNPDANDGHDIAGLAEHVQNSPFVAWGFTPGGGRSQAPGTPDMLAQALTDWGAAGTPCP